MKYLGEREKKCLEIVFEGRDSSKVCDVLGEVVPAVRTVLGERVNTMSFAFEMLKLEHVCV